MKRIALVLTLSLQLCLAANAKDYPFKFSGISLPEAEIEKLEAQKTSLDLIAHLREKGIRVLVLPLKLTDHETSELDPNSINLAEDQALVDFYQENWLALHGDKGEHIAGWFAEPGHVVFLHDKAVERRGDDLPIMVIKKATTKGMLIHESIHALLFLEREKKQDTSRSALLKTRDLQAKLRATEEQLKKAQGEIDSDDLATYSQQKAEYALQVLQRARLLAGEEIDVTRFQVEKRKSLGIEEHAIEAELPYLGNNIMDLKKTLNEVETLWSKATKAAITADKRTLRDFANAQGKQLWDDVPNALKELGAKYNDALSFYLDSARKLNPALLKK